MRRARLSVLLLAACSALALTAHGAIELALVEITSPPVRSWGVGGALAEDMDGDGDLDLVVTGGDILSWWSDPGDPDDDWARTDIWEPATPGIFEGSLAVGDLDGDGSKDVVTTGDTGGRVVVHLAARPAGQGWPQRLYSPGGGHPHPGRKVQVDDLDADGDLDVVSAGGTLGWWQNGGDDLGGGDGATWRRRDLSATRAREVLVADLDGDGDLDVVAVAGGVRWWENGDDAAGGGYGASWRERWLCCPDATGVEDADLDGDGDLDLAIHGDKWAGVALNQDGSGTAWDELQIAGLPPAGRSFRAGDLDGDGDADLAGFGDGLVRWWRNGDSTGDGDGTQWTELPLAEGLPNGDASLVALADVDDDDDLDLFGAGGSRGEVVVWLNGGDDGGDGDGTTWTESRIGGDPWVSSWAVGDADGDGLLEIAVTSTGFLPPSGHALLDNPGSLGPRWPRASFEGEPWVSPGAFVDLDDDGDLDIAGAGNEGTWLQNGGDASGGGQGQTWLRHGEPTIWPGYGYVRTTVLGDLDGDGRDDVFGGPSLDGWWRNTGSGLEPVECGWDSNFASGAGDVDLDGDLDVLLGGSPGWRLNGGDSLGGGDGTTWSATLGPDISGTATVDLDGDGDLDVVASGGGWFEGDGTGSSWTHHSIGPTAGPAVAGDLDGDGDLDVFASHDQSWGGATAFQNGGDDLGGGDGLVWDAAGAPLPGFIVIQQLVAVDLDGDGVDEIVANHAGQLVAWVLADNLEPPEESPGPPCKSED